MALTQELIDKVKVLVYQRPRNIRELALALDINWRTADRYIEQIKQRTGLVETHTFGGEGKGSMKIVFWSHKESIYSTQVQEKVFADIAKGVEKSDFSPLEIFQYVPTTKRSAYAERITYPYYYDPKTLFELLDSAKEEICVFAGNCSWIHHTMDGKSVFELIKDLLERNVRLKIITKVHLDDLDNIRQLLSLNNEYNEERIELRHGVTPLRCYVIDEVKAKFSEKLTAGDRPGQTTDDYGIFYEISDELWVSWLKKMFWQQFQNAIPANKRISALETIYVRQ